MLSSAPSSRTASAGPLLSSGPWPPYPLGSSRVTPLGWPHLSSPAATMVHDHLGLVRESPNCPSHITRASAFALSLRVFLKVKLKRLRLISHARRPHYG
jgi:hypothetical protein